ncbi:MAG: SdrD B-like domain-containing protein [Crocosphaera sp.]|nr:SdrD B-like domain-containing protein [Crocosphaera sp.]
MTDSSAIQKLSAALPDQVVFSVVFDTGSDPDASYLDMTIKDTPGTDNVLEGMTFDAYCIDTDRPIFVDREPIDGLPEYTADVYSSYEPLPSELIGPGLIEFPENLDLVNWIINQGFEGKELFDELGNSLGIVTSGDVQRAIWELIDDEQSTGGLGSFSQARADRIVALAQANGEDFVPSFEYTTIFGEQVTGQMAVIFVPDSNGDGLPNNQIVIGEVELAKIGDRIFFDLNGNNQYDDGEGLDGVDVKLLADVDGDGTIESDEVIHTATTSDDGMYMFEVIPGDYQVMVDTDTLPPGYRNTFDPDSPAPPDNNNMSEVRLNPGENNPDQDFGYQAYDYGDAPDTYGTTNGTAGARHLLSNGQTDGTPILKLGALVDTELDGQPLPDALGDDNNNLDDEDGVTFSNLQAGEQASVTVNVMSMGITGPAYLNAWIDFNGDGNFDDPGEQIFVDQIVVNGANVLTFDVPENAVSEQITYARFRLSTQVGLGATGDAPDGEVEDYQVTIEPLAPPLTGSIGDRIWSDNDGDGVQDAGEAGINGVTVLLIDQDTNQVIDTVMTSGDGQYLFNNLPQGNYTIKVDTATLPSNVVQTGDPDAVLDDMSMVNLSAGGTNLDQDFGYQPEPAKIGDRVFYDIDQDGIQDDGEVGIAGVEVLLLDADGNQLDSTTTDETGMYMFNNLAPGDYKVQFTQPDGFEFVSPFLVGDNPEIDSDANPNNSLMSGVITLNAGEFNNTIDAGFFRRTKPGIDIEKATNGQDADNPTGPEIPVGGTATFTYEVTNTGDIALDNVEVIDDNGTPDDTSDDFTPDFVGGDTDGDGQLDVGEVWRYEATRTVTEGQYTNEAMVTGHAPNGTIVMDMDTSNHFGLELAKIGDFVWHDFDADGIQDEGEPGIVGAIVKLLDASNNNILQTTTTDGSGMYMFNDLNPLLTYKVMFNQPTGFDKVSPFQVGTNPAIDSDANPNNGLMSDPIVLSPGEFNDTIDAGFYQFGRIGDFVFNDLNRDGIQDPDEPGINGAQVKLLDANGTVIATTTTGDDPNTPGTQAGYYEFGGLTPDVEYTVMFVNPTGFGGVSPRQVGNDPTVDSDGLMSDPIKLLSGEFNNTIDAGFFQLPASLGDFVFEDLNANGIQDAGEQGIAGAEVKLLDVNNVVLDTTLTDGTGFYQFTDLDAGQYKVMFNTPTGFDAVSPRQVGNNPAIDSDGLMSDVVTLIPGEFNRTIDSGFYKFAQIGDFVFNDLNENGIQDPDEPGIDGATVKLLDANGNLITTTTTGDDPNTPGTQQGYYEFGGLTPGQAYQVMFVNPDGFSGVSPFQAGNNPNVDSDANPANNLTSNPVIPLSGQFVDNIDAGFFQVPDIVLEKFTNGEDADTPTGPEILVGDTAIFTYKVLNTGETPLVDVVVTDDNGTPDDPSDDFNPTFVDGDNNGNGIFDPGEQWVFTASRTVTPGQYTNIAKVTATNPNSGGMVMDDDPSNHFGVLLPGSIGDFVFNDLNENGIQDPNEPGIDGATVKLLDANGNLLATTTTGDDPNTPGTQQGFYEFTNLNPGDYRVMFVNPEGFDGVSPFLVGSDNTVDSDANPNNNLTSGLINLGNGETNNTIDAGFFRLPASLGDFVFEDLNANGIQDAGEQGIEGAEVKLLDANNNVLETTTTNGNGFYEFTDLDAGQYKVMFNTPTGFDAVSPRQVGNNPAIDSDG